MPNIRLLFADDLPLFIPANSFRLLEEVAPGSNPNFPDQTCTLIYDLGDGRVEYVNGVPTQHDGLQTALLATAPEVVVEQVRCDPRFHDRIVEFRSSGGRIWVLPQHQNGVTGVRPPSPEELSKLDAKLAEDEATFAALDPAAAATERERMEQLRTNVVNRKSYAGLHAKLNLAIPTKLGDQHYAYYVTATANEVDEALNPSPARPVGEKSGRRRAHRSLRS